VFSRTAIFADPRYAVPERFLGVMGMPINAKGEIESGKPDARLPQRRAEHDGIVAGARLQPQQAYVICSVAVDLRISNVVDVPNYVVSALLPEAIFDGRSPILS
jgi:formamidase